MSFWHGYRAGSGMTFSLFPGARFMIASVAADGKVWGVLCASQSGVGHTHSKQNCCPFGLGYLLTGAFSAVSHLDSARWGTIARFEAVADVV